MQLWARKLPVSFVSVSYHRGWEFSFRKNKPRCTRVWMLCWHVRLIGTNRVLFSDQGWMAFVRWKIMNRFAPSVKRRRFIVFMLSQRRRVVDRTRSRMRSIMRKFPVSYSPPKVYRGWGHDLLKKEKIAIKGSNTINTCNTCNTYIYVCTSCTQAWCCFSLFFCSHNNKLTLPTPQLQSRSLGVLF